MDAFEIGIAEVMDKEAEGMPRTMYGFQRGSGMSRRKALLELAKRHPGRAAGIGVGAAGLGVGGALLAKKLKSKGDDGKKKASLDMDKEAEGMPSTMYGFDRASGMSRRKALMRAAQRHPGRTAGVAAGIAGLGVGGTLLAKKLKADKKDGHKKKAGAGNPAQPVKSSLGSGTPEAQRFAPYLNQGGGQAAVHQAGEVQKQPQPYPGYINTGDKGAPQQVAGDIGGRGGSPDTGEKGTSYTGDMYRTKSAAFDAGAEAGFYAAYGDDE